MVLVVVLWWLDIWLVDLVAKLITRYKRRIFILKDLKGKLGWVACRKIIGRNEELMQTYNYSLLMHGLLHLKCKKAVSIIEWSLPDFLPKNFPLDDTEVFLSLVFQIPPEVWCLKGMFLGSNWHLINLGVWKPNMEPELKIEVCFRWFSFSIRCFLWWTMFIFNPHKLLANPQKRCTLRVV